ncbi:chemotaxis protein CheA [Dongia sedimenti]|uniref:Chemotaxis protein CheA n=1 Tax=Dongia sedimenti TaxID=3064282 RepID=A0ABU0YHI4_9PROT|nr:chemotaxis protein CheA [Rhodospirillaceae bacterium R-7]
MTGGGDPTDTFRQEAQELLEQLEQILLDLARSPENAELVDSTFRALHTIKGSGSMFGFDAVAGFTHHVESAFDLVRKGKVAMTAALADIALAGKDHIRNLIERPESADPATGQAILARLEATVGGHGAAPAGPKPTEAGPVAAPTAPTSKWRVQFRLPVDALATGTNPLLLVDELRALGKAVVTPLLDKIPPLEALNATECHIGWDIEVETDKPKSAIEDVFLFVMDEMELKIEPLDAPVPVAAQTAAAPAPAQAAPKAATAAQPAKTATEALKGGGSIRVPAERLDNLMDRVGELVIAQSRLKQIAAASQDSEFKSISEEIERLALELRDTTMGVRMVPIAQLFGRFRRLVHDLAVELGKEITLTTSGEETELDKTVIERLNDPLVHLIRNSIDHGLEPPEQRTAAGKTAQGHIHLSARHTGDKVLISITDDGKGLDRARIRTRAEENGLIAPGAEMSDSELFQVIFQPGFSTAQAVTNLSGRGVGMDVVKRTLDALRGSIDIASTTGKGTEITLRLPLTLAIIDGLLVRIGQGRYVIPLSAVEECVELPPVQENRANGSNFLNIRGDLVPFLRLREMFNAMTPPDKYQKVVVVSSNDMRVGLVVDQVIGDHQTVIKSLSKLHAGVGTFSGATILGDGTVALILEIAHLVARGQRERPMKLAS